VGAAGNVGAAIFYATLALAGYAVELIFNLLHVVPKQRNAQVIEAHISWNYTTWLNIAFLILAAALLARFVTSGGPPMLKMMGGSPDDAAHHDHDHTGHDHAARDHAEHRHGDHDAQSRRGSPLDPDPDSSEVIQDPHAH
jgi:hypothetical protein